MTVMKKLINLWPSIKHKNKINIKIILHYHYYSSRGKKLTNVRSFSILQSREVLTFFNNDKRGRDPFNQSFRKFRSKTQWIGSVQQVEFRKNWSTF